MAWPLVSPELQRALDGTKEGVVLEALGLGNHPLSPPPISPHISPYLRTVPLPNFGREAASLGRFAPKGGPAMIPEKRGAFGAPPALT